MINFDHLARRRRKSRSNSITCAILVAMLRTCVFVALLPGLAAAQPISFKLANNVPAGKKPTLTVTAVERVLGIELDLKRTEDGASASDKGGALAAGKSHTFNIGDGAAGRAHYKGKIRALVPGQEPWEYELTFETVVVSDLKVTYRRDHLDLDRSLLQFQLSRPAKSATIKVIGEQGQELGEGSADY